MWNIMLSPNKIRRSIWKWWIMYMLQYYAISLVSLQGLNKFYEAVMQGILRHIDFSIVKCVILASPGFVKDQFFEYMMQQAIKTDNKLLIENKSKFLLVKASSGFKHSLKGFFYFFKHGNTNSLENVMLSKILLICYVTFLQEYKVWKNNYCSVQMFVWI